MSLHSKMKTLIMELLYTVLSLYVCFCFKMLPYHYVNKALQTNKHPILHFIFYQLVI